MNKQWNEKMATTRPKFYWHIHHEILLEETSNIQKRIDYIEAEKPEAEVPLRLKLMTPVMHPGKLPARFRKASEAYKKAWENYYKFPDSKKAWKAVDKTWKAYDKVWEACNTEIEKLHREEHPDCPWNGKTIFSKVD